jgi:beta-N-acetylhexosaminidase
MLPIIFSCAGTTLSLAEQKLFTRCQPAGFILFKRNCQTPSQTKQLTDALRDCIQQADIPILIDQEGGRVVRLDAPHWWPGPAAVSYLQQTRDITEAAHLAKMDAKRTAEQLKAVGVNVNCAPVVDCPIPGADPIIGERAYSNSPQEIITMAEAVIAGYQAGGVVPIIKHIPGHGRALVDSHKALPVVDASIQDLCNRDFVPFQALAKSVSWAMTAHVIYTAYDTERCATISPKVIQQVIRQHIGFEGVLVSDDLSMKALSEDVVTNVKACLAAGCDLALYCEGNLAEMEQLANHITPIEPISFLP